MRDFLTWCIHYFKAHKKGIYAFLPFPFVILSFCIVYKKPLYLIQTNTAENKQTIPLFSYSDSIHQGKSTIRILKNTTHVLRYQYVLKEGYQYKFTYVAYLADKYFDLSKYSYAEIKIKAQHGTRIQFVLSSYIDQYSEVGKMISYRLSQYILNVNDEFQIITIPFSELYTPDWWYSENQTIESNFNAPDLSKVTDISFSNCINIKNDVVDEVDIEEIKFGYSLVPFYGATAFALSLYYSLFGFILFRKTRKTEVYFENQKAESLTYLNQEEELLFNHLTTHYFKKDLSITDVQTATGINERKISLLIKQKTDLNFKQFINKLRIAEAKRLLTETDLQISEIAFKVGYLNPSHFNRVFKTFEPHSPNDFRKKESKSSK